MENEITISKSTVENFKIKNGYDYASISIDGQGTKGTIQITSSYGNWAFYWGACGTDFKKFLYGLDFHYTAGKFGEDKFFDLESTIQGLKERSKEYFTNDHDLYEFKEEISSLINASCKEEFISIIQDCNRIMEMENHCPDMCYRVSPHFHNFWNKLWTPFIRKEFEN